MKPLLVTVNEQTMTLLRKLQELSAEKPINRSIEKTAVSTSGLAHAVGLSTRRTRELLKTLEDLGLVSRSSERGGWRLVHCNQ